MTQNEFKLFAEMWTSTWSLYDRKVNAGMLEMAFNALSRFEIDEVKNALSRHTQDADKGQFPPKPADLIQILEGDGQSNAHHAWSKVDKAVRHIGPYQSVTFDDPVTQYVLHEMGGWILLCQSSNDEWPYKSNEFVNRYRAAYRRRDTLKYPRLLNGIADNHNQTLPNWSENKRQITFVGDRQKAQVIYQNGNDNLLSYHQPFKTVGELQKMIEMEDES